MDNEAFDYAAYAQVHEPWIDYPGYPLECDFSKDEYELRLRRTRSLMAQEGLDALVITSSVVGHWFTSLLEPHEWHDLHQVRSAWYILTADGDYLYMTPTSAGEHFNTTRRSTWVTYIHPIVERATWPRREIWALEQMPGVFAELGLERGRLGFELGDCMTLGINVNDFLALRELMPRAQLVDGSAVIRRLMSVHTPWEIECVRNACGAAVWIYDQIPGILRPGLTERQFVDALGAVFTGHFSPAYAYQVGGLWDVRNPGAGDSNIFHEAVTDRAFRDGDLVARGASGASYRGYGGDVDRLWYIGDPPQIVRDYYRVTWECNRAMAEMIKPGNTCADIYAACARVQQQHGFPERLSGRVGHGLRNTGGLSVHPGNRTVLEPGMIISAEPIFVSEYGWFDLEDQYVVTETGREILHDPAPEQMPCIAV